MIGTTARILVTLLAVNGDPKPPDSARPDGAPLVQGLGSHHHQIETPSPEAQRYFDQGMVLLFGFNHNEAIRSFERAARLDPQSPMPHWAIAFASGPNINAPMTEEGAKRAMKELEAAQALVSRAPAREQAYVAALVARYSTDPAKSRASLDLAFADAMRELSRAYPSDLDAATLFAEALMDTMPWSYWTPEGQPKTLTREAVGVLESVLERQPDHPGANHFYIHAVEASPNPERGLASAHRLLKLAPAAGHLVHMPAHIFLRLGQYPEASAANERAIAADESYIAQCKVQGFYPATYYSHNIHFLWYSATMEGRRAVALAAARKAAAGIPAEPMPDMPQLAWIKVVPIMALARFGDWEDVLAEPLPPADALYATAITRHARGVAHARKLEAGAAARELAALDAIAADPRIETLEVVQFPGASLIRLARSLLAAELAAARGETEEADRLFQDAVEREGRLGYMEPPFWYYPTRHSFGGYLLRSGRLEQAQTVFEEDLKKNPENGWALFGLLESLRRQGKSDTADAVHERLRAAWRQADFFPTPSSL